MTDLARVEAFAASIPETPWFARVGQGVSEGDRDTHDAYVAALGLDTGSIASVSGWRDAARVSSDPAWDRRWWEAEARERKRLQARAEERHGPETTLKALTKVAEAALVPTRAAADAAGDEALSRVAAGAAAQACHLAALALAAGRPTHGFLAKHRLFADGRWPLGRIGEQWYLF
ncbi:MAG: hypothetical protein FJX60_19685 [Alphaproteobacteria bacterium]|nr:hypothetical protein [Alphaproteobacteria bacterium]